MMRAESVHSVKFKTFKTFLNIVCIKVNGHPDLYPPPAAGNIQTKFGSSENLSAREDQSNEEASQNQNLPNIVEEAPSVEP